MTRLVGVPNSVPTGTSVRVTLHWEVPYRDPARGATPNVLTATYDWADGKYKIGGTEMAFVHPRPDQPDPALKGSLVAAYTIGTGASAARPRYVLQAHETAPGELDMRVDPSPTQVIAAQSLLSIIAAAQDIPTKIAQVDQKLIQVDDNLAGIAQSRNTLTQLAGLKQSTTIAGIPDVAGLYLITAGTDAAQVWLRPAPGQPTERRPELEALSRTALTDAQGLNVLDYRVTADGADIMPALARAINAAAGQRTVKLAPGTYTARSLATVSTGFTLDARGVTLTPDLDSLPSWAGLITVDSTNTTVDTVRIDGLRSDGQGWYGRLVACIAGGAVGVHRDVQLTNCTVTNYMLEPFRVGWDGDATGQMRVENLLITGNTFRNLGQLNRMTATGATGSATVQLTTRDQFSVAAKTYVGLRVAFGGGGETYLITGFNAASGQITVSPALTRAITDQWVYGRVSFDPSANRATGTAGSATVTVQSGTYIVPGMRLAFRGVRGQYMVQSVSGTTVTLTTPLRDSMSSAWTFAGWSEVHAIAMGGACTQATVALNTCRGASGNFVSKAPGPLSWQQNRVGDFVFAGNRVAYVRMGFECPALNSNVQGTAPTVNASLGGTVLTVTNLGAVGGLAANGWTVGAIINVGQMPRSYRITAVDEGAGTLTCARFDMDAQADVAGGFADSVTGMPVYLVQSAAGQTYYQLGGNRAVFTGNVVEEVTRDILGYAVSWGTEQIVLSGNVFHTTQRAVLELSARNVVSKGNSYRVTNWRVGLIAPQQATSIPAQWRAIAGFFEVGEFDDVMTCDHEANPPQTLALWETYPRGSFPWDATLMRISGQIVGFTRRLFTWVPEARQDRVIWDRAVIDAPDCTDYWDLVQGRGWRYQGCSIRVGAVSRLLRLPGTNLFGDARFDLAVKRNEIQFGNPTATLMDSAMTALVGAGVRVSGNEYLRGGVWTEDQVVVPPDPGLDSLKAWNGISPFLFGDSFRRADSATLGTSTSGGVWTNAIAGWTISGNKATVPSGLGIALYNAGTANHEVGMTVVGTGEAWLTFRSEAGYTHRWRFGATTYSADGGTTNAKFYELQYARPAGEGGLQIVAGSLGVGSRVGDALTVKAKGNTISAYVNGVLVASISDSRSNDQTNVGIQGTFATGLTPALSSFTLKPAT